MQLFELFGDIIIRDDGANQRIGQIDNSAGKAGGTFSKLSGFAGKVGIGLAAVGVAAVGVATAIGVKAFNASEELQKSLNGLQAATGQSDEAMKDMKASMLDIYNNNFGESFEDIGQSMSTIAQQTGLTGKALTDITKDALAMRDTFEFEVNESIRSADMIMNQFGVSGEQAYNLIAQGAQIGLNKNDDLLDTINEYSIQFKQLGFNAEEMFNMLSNGAAGGTWSVDKLGDAVKEFGIRVKDGSDGTSTAFTSLGLNTNKISKDFAAGGESGKKAFETVTKKLLEMKDPLQQNQVGVALFGTMWEDLGAKGIAALTNTNGAISTTVNALEKINQVKYNTFGEAVEGIKRQLETGLLLPIGDKILPVLSEMASWVNAHMPEIQSTISTVMGNVGGAIDNVSNLVLPVLKQGFEIFTTDVLPPLKSIFESYVSNVFPALSSVFSAFTTNVLPPLISLFRLIVSNVLPPFLAVLKFLYETIVPKLAENFKVWMPEIGKIIQNLVTTAKPVLESFQKVFQAVFPVVKDVVTTALNAITPIVSGLLKILNGIITFVRGTFTGDWKTVWNGIKQIFGGVWETISGLVKANVNIIIDLVNGMIRGLNKLKIEVPDWVPGMGGKNFGINIPQIPKFDQGTDYITHDMLAMVHKGEKITPAAYNPDNPNNRLGSGSGAGFVIEVPLIVEGKTIAKAIAKFSDKELFNLNPRGVATT